MAAALLAEQGHDVIGVSMQLYPSTPRDEAHGLVVGRSGQVTTAVDKCGTCCTIDDLYDARRVAATIGIPHYIVNFESQFGEHVISNFVREYVSGRTPIPCSHCNSDLKFAELLDRATAYDAEQLATGHYARIVRDDRGRYHLYRGADTSKDQTYFLFSLTQAQLGRAAFPVGHLDKDTVREHARRLNLHVTSKPDSQEICFVPDGDYAAFVERQAPEATRAGHHRRPRRPRRRHARRRAPVHHRPAQGPWLVLHRAALRARDQAGVRAGGGRARATRSAARN